MATWDAAKRAATLRERGLDFADAELVFATRRFYTRPDRREYGEAQNITVAYLSERFVVIVWTGSDEDRRIISMRHGHEREEKRFRGYLD